MSASTSSQSVNPGQKSGVKGYRNLRGFEVENRNA